jgi:putative transposase
MLFGDAAIKVSNFLTQYAESKGIHMKVNYVNPEHVHALVDMPTHYCIEEMLKLLKGASSHWINLNRLVRGKFFWGRGYGVFSVSQSNVGQVVGYIASQAEHHRNRTFMEEYEDLLKRYDLRWIEAETVETVGDKASKAQAPR